MIGITKEDATWDDLTLDEVLKLKSLTGSLPPAYLNALKEHRPDLYKQIEEIK